MSIPLWYVCGVLLIALAVTFTLRALPFAILEPLRASECVGAMAAWMPAGILLLLVLTTFRSSVQAEPGSAISAGLASAVTIAVHLLCGRRTLLSIGAGTVAFVVLVNLVA